MSTQRLKEYIKDSNMSNTFPPKKTNFYKTFENLCDNQKYGITKINTKINNNPFNIILLDKKSNHTNHLKNQSFSNLSIKGSFNNEKQSEIKSENNNDESSEKLHSKINNLLFNKKVIKKISPTDIKLDLHSETIIHKNNSINIKDYDYINENQNLDKISFYETETNKLDAEKENNSREEDLPKYMLNENIKVNDLMENCNSINITQKHLGNSNNIKLKVCRSFTSCPYKKEKENEEEEESVNSKEKIMHKRKSNISQDLKNNKNNSLYSSINELLKSVNDKNKEYNFDSNKEHKRYKNLDEIKEDKNYFRLLYLSSNLFEIIKKKNKYQAGENDSYENILKKQNPNLNNKNYYIYTNDRNVLKLTALFFQKVKKAIFLFNTGKYENAYNSLIDDKIIKNKKTFALFLLIIQGIDKEKLYTFLSENTGINKNFCVFKYYLSFFNFTKQTVIISFNFLLETLSIPTKNNDDLISLFTEAYIKDNKNLIKNEEMGKNEIKKICGLVLKLNHIMYDPDEEKHKNKEDFINSNNDATNWNPDLNHLISNDPSTTTGLMNYSHVCGVVFDEYIKNENSMSQQKCNQRAYNELLYKKLLVNNKSFSFQNSLIKNEINNTNESNLIETKEYKKKKISIIVNNKVLYKPKRIKKSIFNYENQIKTNSDSKDEYNNILDENKINKTIKLMKKGEKFSKITNLNGRTVKVNFTLTQDENNIFLIKDLCCERKEILSIEDISDCIIGYSRNLKTNKNFENYMTIILNSEQIFEFYHADKQLIQNYVKALEYLVQKRNKVSAILLQKKQISEKEVSNIWQNEFLPNWILYRKYIMKKKNKNIENNLNLESNNNRKEKILKIWSLGLPFWLRANMWKLVIVNELNITEVLFQGYFHLVMNEKKIYNINKNNTSMNCSIDIVDENHNIIQVISKDCSKIIKRIDNILIEVPDKNNFKDEVYNIVRCFCLYRPDVIYSKNISELATFFFINCDMNEYDTFVMLCNFIITNYFFKHIQNDTSFMKNQLKFFEKLIEKYLPSIHLHFKELQFNTNIFFYKWIEYLFLKTFNYKICLRIFDNFIIKGQIFVFEISIATLYILRKEILNSDESGLVYLLKKNIINVNEDALFEYINTLNIRKEYEEYYDIDILGSEKGELLQEL